MCACACRLKIVSRCGIGSRSSCGGAVPTKTLHRFVAQYMQGLHRYQSNFIDSSIVLQQSATKMHRSPVPFADRNILETKETRKVHPSNRCNPKVAIATFQCTDPVDVLQSMLLFCYQSQHGGRCQHQTSVGAR